ncbi:aldose 1-epimerase family protein [Rhodococcus koreensis]|uniref:aldose 1-epimerase family protein n=1 Tax=Rhodococcus koreensis TaxID=99653 RepID=UPI003672693B
MRSPTGQQFDLVHIGNARWNATVTEVGAGLRTLSVNSVDIVEGFGIDEIPAMSAGKILLPWANRVHDGRWQLDGQEQQLAITEPARGNAIHGFMRYTPHNPTARSADSVTLSAPLFPQPGYPFSLESSVTYRLDDEGLTVTHAVTNVGTKPAPTAIGAHPYLKIDGVPTDDLVLTVDAKTHFAVDERMNASTRGPVTDLPHDLTRGVRIGDVTLDTCLGDVAMTNRQAQHRLNAPDGRFLTIWGDHCFRYVHVFTTDKLLPTGDTALAIEPMTAPVNALNTGEGLRWITPEQTWTAQWGIGADGFHTKHRG